MSAKSQDKTLQEDLAEKIKILNSKAQTGSALTLNDLKAIFLLDLLDEASHE